MIKTEKVLSHLEATRQDLLSSFRGLTEEEIDYQVSDNSWTIGEVLQHLLLVERAVLLRSEKLMRGELPSERSFWNRLRKLPVRWAVYRGVKVKTSKRLDPRGLNSLAKGELVRRLSDSRAKLLMFLDNNCDKDLSTYRFPHLLFGALNIYEWMMFIGYHEERHRRQIEQIVAKIPH